MILNMFRIVIKSYVEYYYLQSIIQLQRIIQLIIIFKSSTKLKYVTFKQIIFIYYSNDQVYWYLPHVIQFNCENQYQYTCYKWGSRYITS